MDPYRKKHWVSDKPLVEIKGAWLPALKPSEFYKYLGIYFSVIDKNGKPKEILGKINEGTAQALPVAVHFQNQPYCSTNAYGNIGSNEKANAGAYGL